MNSAPNNRGSAPAGTVTIASVDKATLAKAYVVFQEAISGKHDGRTQQAFQNFAAKRQGATADVPVTRALLAIGREFENQPIEVVVSIMQRIASLVDVLDRLDGTLIDEGLALCTSRTDTINSSSPEAPSPESERAVATPALVAALSNVDISTYRGDDGNTYWDVDDDAVLALARRERQS